MSVKDSLLPSKNLRFPAETLFERMYFPSPDN